MQRRRFIGLLGSAGAFAIGTGALRGWLECSMPPSALTAWSHPQAHHDVRLWALAHAILAPNPHNLQPWLIDLGQPGEIHIRLDPTRLLPCLDASGRQTLIGTGAFLELLSIAAAERGYRAAITLFPEGKPEARLDDQILAKVQLLADPTTRRDPLHAAILHRRTDRRPHDAARRIEPHDADRVLGSVAAFPLRTGLLGGADSHRTEVAAMRALTCEAYKIELSTPAATTETMQALRVGRSEIDRHRDGISITSPIAVALSKMGLLDRQSCPPPDSAITRSELRRFSAIASATRAWLWIATEGNRHEDHLLAGRAYARASLAATLAGLAMHPTVQALSDFPEMVGVQEELHRLLGIARPRYAAQMLARIGHLPDHTRALEPAPRRGLAAHLIEPAAFPA